MVQFTTVPEGDTRDDLVATPLDDYELLDFGGGHKLERWRDYLPLKVSDIYRRLTT